MYCFFFNDTATTEIYPLSLHDALPIYGAARDAGHHRFRHPFRVGAVAHHVAQEDEALGALPLGVVEAGAEGFAVGVEVGHEDRKSTRLNSSHANISYAVFCLKKKKIIV